MRTWRSDTCAPLSARNRGDVGDQRRHTAEWAPLLRHRTLVAQHDLAADATQAVFDVEQQRNQAERIERAVRAEDRRLRGDVELGGVLAREIREAHRLQYDFLHRVIGDGDRLSGVLLNGRQISSENRPLKPDTTS